MRAPEATKIDLKLWPMRFAVGRMATVLLVFGSALYMLQVAESTAARPAPPPRASPPASLPSLPAASHATYHPAHEAIVPYGRTVLDLPILMYHYVRLPPPPTLDLMGFRLTVAPDAFAAQMDWLAANGYHTVTFDNVRRYWARVTPLPAKPVIITLDDGYQDLYTTAYPILVAHGFTAVAYIVSGFVGERGYVTQGEILEMDRYGIEIAAHTVNHANLAKASQAQLTYQVVESKSWLEKLVGHPVVDMAYPSGQYSQAAIAAVQRAGYYSAVTVADSVQHTQSNRYEWGRVRIGGAEALGEFITNLGPTMAAVVVTRVTSDSSPAALQQRT
jgi:peptidoglycan/xylan/chitin deacetylase (PgdA/CDA1 family)